MSVEAGRRRDRPRPFADLWEIQGTPRPPTTVANPLGAAGRREPPVLAPLSIGERYRRLSVEELAAVPSVDRSGGIELSPDGSEVAFAWDRTGDLEIYSAPLRGDRIIQLTEADARSFAPRWSPDGRWIAFLRDEGGEGASLRLVDRDGEHERGLTAVAGAYRDHAWSPRGDRIALGDGRALYVIDVASGESPRVADGVRPQWSPDGEWILFSRATGLWVVDAKGGEPRALVRDEGERIGDARWSPDGSTIAFTTTVDRRSEIAFAHLRAGPAGGMAGPPGGMEGAVTRVERLGVTPYDDTDPAWRPDGRGVVYRRHERGSVALRRTFTISHADDAVLDVPGSCGVAQVGPDSETVVAVLAEATRGVDVVIRPKGAVTIARITRSLPGEIDPRVLVEPVHVAGTDRAGGALVYVPHVEALRGERRAVAVVHADRPERDWDPAAQVLANHGHAVVVTAAREPDAVARAKELLTAARLAESGTMVVRYDATPEVFANRPAREQRLRELLSRAERGA